MGRYDLTERKSPWSAILKVLLGLFILAGGVWFYYTPQTTDEAAIKVQDLPVPRALKELAVNDTVLSLNDGGQADDITGTAGDGLEQTAVSTVASDIATETALPTLADSDALFRSKVTDLSPDLAMWLNTRDLIRKTVVVANDFAQGQRLYKHIKSFSSPAPFVPDQDEQGLYMANKSYQRYNALAAALDVVNVEAALNFYRVIKPLCNQVFAEFNYPENYDLDDIVKKAAAEILAAPVIDGRVDLIKPSVHYRFADKSLEALNPVHKQMVRMGPQNTRIIQNKLRLLLEALVAMED